MGDTYGGVQGGQEERLLASSYAIPKPFVQSLTYFSVRFKRRHLKARGGGWTVLVEASFFLAEETKVNPRLHFAEIVYRGSLVDGNAVPLHRKDVPACARLLSRNLEQGNSNGHEADRRWG